MSLTNVADCVETGAAAKDASTLPADMDASITSRQFILGKSGLFLVLL